MRGSPRCTQIIPSVVLSLVLACSCWAAEGPQQESPTRVTGAAGSKIDPIERRRRQSGLVGVREADHASRTRSEPSQDARSDGGREDNGGDTNTDNIGRTESFSWGGPWLESLAALPGEARATRGGGHDAGSTITMKRSPPASHPAAPEQGWSEEQPRRRLQDDGSCAVGDAFTVSSTLYRSANGCYQTIFEEDPYTFVSATFISDTTLAIAVGDRLVLPTSALGAPSSYDLPDFWLMLEVFAISTAGPELSLECQSYEFFTEAPHPSDVSAWYCFIAGGWMLVSADTFSMTCGCGDGPTPAPAATAPTPVDADSPQGNSGCGNIDPFAIVSSQLPELEGCYRDTGMDEGDTFFSLSGEREDGEPGVYPAPFDEQALDLRWVVGTYYPAADNATATCVSDEAPSDAHPADSTFYCDFTGTGAYTPVTEDRFNIVCGCDGTTAPTTAPARDRDFAGTTPSPASADGVGVASTPSPAGADGVGVVASTPSPAGGDETDTDTAFGANGGPAVAPGPRARLPAIVAVALSAVLMGVL